MDAWERHQQRLYWEAATHCPEGAVGQPPEVCAALTDYAQQTGVAFVCAESDAMCRAGWERFPKRWP